MLLDDIGVGVDLDEVDDVDVPKVMLETLLLGAHGCCSGVVLTGGLTGVVGLCTEPGVCAAGLVDPGDTGVVVCICAASAAEAQARLTQPNKALFIAISSFLLSSFVHG